MLYSIMENNNPHFADYGYLINQVRNTYENNNTESKEIKEGTTILLKKETIELYSL